jgi:hypothetical protein
MAFVVVGSVLVVVAFIGGVIATIVASWFHSVCNDGAAVVNANRQALRLDALAAWFVATAVPVTVALIARRQHRRIWPWTTLAGVFLLIALIMTLSIEPSRFCVY